jgi:NDP-sugar pyrophosphorylase family protein
VIFRTSAPQSANDERSAMRALVLSAGLGERLRPLTNEVPKPLLEVAGRPLIHYSLLMLSAAGITEIAINVHHLAGKIESALGNGDSLGVRITYSPEPMLLGTGGPLAALRGFLDDGPFVMLNCDTIMGLDLATMIRFHRDRGGLATFALRESGNSSAYSIIEIDREARIRRMRLLRGRSRGEFDDYPQDVSATISQTLQPTMYCGALVAEPAVLQFASKPPPFSLVADVFAPMMTQSIPLFGYLDRSFFRTVDDLGSYEALRKEFPSAPPPLDYLPR